MNAEMRDEYFEALGECAEDAAIRAVVLTGTGKGFCTGADLSRLACRDGRRRRRRIRAPRATRWRRSQRVIRALWDLEKPIIAGGERRGGRASARTSPTPATW